MGRMYVPSTPYTRGEKDPGELEGGAVAPAELTVDDLSAAAEERGYRLVPVEPSGNAKKADWLEYARKLGAEDADLVDADGKELTVDALKEKYATPAVKTEVTGD